MEHNFHLQSAGGTDKSMRAQNIIFSPNFCVDLLYQIFDKTRQGRYIGTNLLLDVKCTGTDLLYFLYCLLFYFYLT